MAWRTHQKHNQQTNLHNPHLRQGRNDRTKAQVHMWKKKKAQKTLVVYTLIDDDMDIIGY
jgi:hypothetical protein